MPKQITALAATSLDVKHITKGRSVCHRFSFFFSFFPFFPPFFPLARALVFTTAVWFNDVDVLMAVFGREENWKKKLEIHIESCKKH